MISSLLLYGFERTRRTPTSFNPLILVRYSGLFSSSLKRITPLPLDAYILEPSLATDLQALRLRWSWQTRGPTWGNAEKNEIKKIKESILPIMCLQIVLNNDKITTILYELGKKGCYICRTNWPAIQKRGE